MVWLHASNAKIVRHHACPYIIQMNCTIANIQVDTYVWLIPNVDATLNTTSTTLLRSGTNDSTSWCCKHVKITLRKTSCEVNSKLTNNCHWKCVHYCGISRFIIMKTFSFYRRGLSGVYNTLIYIWTIGRSKPKRWCRDLGWCLQS